MSEPDNTAPQTPTLGQRIGFNGLKMGIYLTFLAFLSAFAMGVPFLSFLVWGGSIGLPLFMYSHLRRSYGLIRFETTYGQLWAEGTASFFLGASIQAVAIYIGLRFLAPHFIADCMDQTMGLLADMGTPEARQMEAMLRQQIAAVGIPTNSAVAFNFLSTNFFIGVVMSALVSVILVFRYRDPERRDRLADYLEKHPY